jgi:hypothetical protein
VLIPPLPDVVSSYLLSQHHSTALPSAKRYDYRYEEEFQEEKFYARTNYLRGHGGEPEDVEVRAIGIHCAMDISSKSKPTTHE